MVNRNLNPQQFFHGTDRNVQGSYLKPGHAPNYESVAPEGQKIYKSRKHVYATTDIHDALEHSGVNSIMAGAGEAWHTPMVHKVVPTGKIKPDPEDTNPDNPVKYTTKARWKIIGSARAEHVQSSLKVGKEPHWR